jgi:indolepyruvate ferredoxin oxidoreductase
MLQAFRLLAKLRFLRGTPLDPFGHSADRRLERDLIQGYEKDVDYLIPRLSPQIIDIATELLSLPERIRGYGPVKEKAVAEARQRYEVLMRDLANPPPLVAPQLAAE